MKSTPIAVVAWGFVIACFASNALGATIIDFESFVLGSQSNLAASSANPAPLVESDVSFPRSWSTEFDCCPGGWAVSNQTDQSTPGLPSSYAAYASLSQGGGYQSAQFAVASNFARGEATVLFPTPATVQGMYVTNTTYGYLAVAEGNDGAGFVKGPFGTGDWFRLDVIGIDSSGAETGRVPFFLADFRNGAADVIRDWTWLDLTPLGDAVARLEFEMDSTDSGMFGMNTPAFFAVDQLTFSVVPEPTTGGLVALGAALFVLRGSRGRASRER